MFEGWRKSAEEMVSGWAVKRICKFFLKKKLGQFILGDIDLDQLDVQLTQGSIQLSDLALNVDFLNQKFGAAAPLVVKEGSVGSLLVKMPWKGNGCQVEVDELELVLAPSQDIKLCAEDENYSTSQDNNESVPGVSEQSEHATIDSASMSALNDVHEGVKTIAKMVKWFLTSFHVRIKKVIVAFDPFVEKDGNKMGPGGTLVLRISETECGTFVSEDAGTDNDARSGSFLGISCLTNFIKFQGATLELLHMSDVDHQAGSPRASDTRYRDAFPCCPPSDSRTSIMTGKRGKVSGNIKLSIPWKNGSLDIRKVDADVCIDPIEISFQPRTIKWLLLSWDIYKRFQKDRRDNMVCKSFDSVYFNASSHFHSSSTASSVLAADKVIPSHASYSTYSSLNEQESVTESMLPSSHVISDWVPLPVNKNRKDEMEDIDLGASVDQFFECFDGMRNSQSALVSSGMWSWTCSVFSAITAASNLASGSFNILPEQQHVQTNLKAVFTSISVVFSFYDEDQKQFHDPKGNQVKVGFHCLGAECRDIIFLMQVCPREMRFEGTVKHIELADYISNEIDVIGFQLRECYRDTDSQTVLIQHLQAQVESALPPFASSDGVNDSDELDDLVTPCFPSSTKGDIVKISFFRTSGVTCCQFIVDHNPSHGRMKGSTSFSLKLPPFVFWVNFHLISILWDFCEELKSSNDTDGKHNGFSFEAVNEKCGSSQMERKGSAGPPVTTISSTESSQGNISISNARVLLCFPFRSGKDIKGYCSWDQFIALDFSTSNGKGVIQKSIPIADRNSQKRFSASASRSLHLGFSKLDIFLITSDCGDDVRNNFCSAQGSRYYAHHVLSAINGRDQLSVISMIWQEGQVTGPWVAERAKFLATFEESRNRNKFVGRGYEFATVNTVKDLEAAGSRTQQEIILSSALLVHVCMFQVKVHLDSSHYSGLRGLLYQINNWLSSMANDTVHGSGESPASQTSVLVECDSAELSIGLNIKENIKSSMQSELPGSWHSLKLRIQKFNLLSVSDIGGIKGSSFFWLAHGEGSLWGSVTGVPDQEFLLISCSNSTMKRGDGGGSNALSTRLAGSDIVHLLEPETCHSFTSITVRCSTIVAVGGRLDWFEAITSFFSLHSSEMKADSGNLLNEDSTSLFKASFLLNFVDVGLSYEPHFMKLMVDGGVPDSQSFTFSEETGGQYVACLLAASSFVLSNTTAANIKDNYYKIRMHDLGLLLSAISEPASHGGNYSAQYLQETGYVRVAREALLEAVLRTSCTNGLQWEFECSKSHIYMDTCHDTTSGLICLAAQLQQIFAPDMEESFVHLQNRYDRVQHEQERNDFVDDRGTYTDSASSSSQMHALTVENESQLVGLMDEISEDAFHLNGSATCQSYSSESQLQTPVHDTLIGESCGSGVEETCPHVLVNRSMPQVGLENNQTSFLQDGYLPEFIEGYCLSDLRPLSEVSRRQSSGEMLKSRTRNANDEDFRKGSSIWYDNACLEIVENHLSNTTEHSSMTPLLEGKLPPIESSEPDEFGKALGRVLLNNIDLTWRIYAGSDWHESQNSVGNSTKVHGRDMTSCLELALSAMQFQYDVFPIGGMCVSKISFSVQDFHLFDRSRAAPWKMVLGHYNSKDHPRESSSKAFKLVLEAVRPNPLTPLEEYRLQVAVLPMLLHLHQCQLDFLIGFFGAKSSSMQHSGGPHKDFCGPQLSAAKGKNLSVRTISDEALLPYFQKFDIWPILVRVDYSPRRVDLAALGGGKYVELVNLVPWKGVELQLKHVHAVGIYGWGSVCETILGEWLEDISQNQIHKVLRGLPTIRSLTAVSAGAAKLVSLPVESYRKDKRILKGMQRGTIAFLRSISVEAVGLGVHLASGAHDLLLQAEYILTNNPPSVSQPTHEKTKASVRCNQPKDAQQGIQQAYESLSDGLGRSASALVRTPLKKYQHGGSAGSVLATAVRGVPAAAIAPASACASAVHYALLGIRNSLDPEHKKESIEKYMGPSQSQDKN